jgi:hypothetical protein
LVTVYHPLTTMAVYPPRQLYGHRVSSARRDGGILPRQLSYHYVLSASRECDVLAQPTLQSPMSKALAREPNKRYSERLMLMIHYSYVI